MATTDVITTTGTWTAPAGCFKVVVECWGAGGDVGSTTVGGEAGAGGGAYAKKLLTVVPGTTYTVTVGVSGGADSWFSTSGTVLAKGGSSVANDTGTHGAGGQAASCIGDTVYSGGDGADSNRTNGGAGGGGGGGAGTSGPGGTASTTTAGSGTATDGGNGGSGGGAGTNSNGNVGSTFGGGAGGGSRSSGTRSGALGAAGKVQMTYAVATGSEVSGTPVDTALASFSASGSEISGVPIDKGPVKIGFQNQSKSNATWTENDTKH